MIKAQEEEAERLRMEAAECRTLYHVNDVCGFSYLYDEFTYMAMIMIEFNIQFTGQGGTITGNEREN